MKEWFSVRTDKFNQVDWFSGPYESYNGPLILGGNSASVGGGFGNFLLQGAFRPLFDM